MHWSSTEKSDISLGGGNKEDGVLRIAPVIFEIEVNLFEDSLDSIDTFDIGLWSSGRLNKKARAFFKGLQVKASPSPKGERHDSCESSSISSSFLVKSTKNIVELVAFQA